MRCPLLDSAYPLWWQIWQKQLYLADRQAYKMD